MNASNQQVALTSAIRALNQRDFDAPAAPVTADERALLIAQCSYLQNALDRWRAAIVHAPAKPCHAEARKRMLVRDLLEA